ncbi:KedN5 family methylcobalamin-dependent radical SAM C-methyltransferase [Nocardia sp. NPDC048505]|uniref:KedN5 family methylcobalamin-dependent radical SAM C-methyltransferase n=1 Tax=Nocardia sp. NPDC048505 TaxID=3155756 RepID=UPI0033ECBCCF
MKISLVQAGAWQSSMESMPLAIGYLKAVLDSDKELADEVDVTLHNLPGDARMTDMVRELFAGPIPDMMGFSVFGWNYQQFAALAETFKQLNPRGIVVFGGNHVAYQGERVFRMFPQVDIVVNGEGEITFREIVARVLLDGTSPDLSRVRGISVRDGTRALSTPDEERIDNLDSIPSPFLTGTIPMLDSSGRFRYDVALMETNRGCPYKCAFCYWGGAVGQRMRSFSRERMREELDYFGFYQVPTVVLCDSNFGMLETDEDFVEDLIATRKRHGYPRALETSWAKNKSSRFQRIVKRLRDHGFKSSFTLSLQTLSDDALTEMQRRNMKVNQWEPLVEWLTEEGLDCFAELIWGAPGETVASFLEGYDRLAHRVPRIAVYPLLLLPNTAYSENRREHGFVTVRGESDDFEYVLANNSASFKEHLDMQRFMLWARVLGEHQYFRELWRPLRELAGVTQSVVIGSVREWIDNSEHPAARAFASWIPTVAESPAVARALRTLYEDSEMDTVLREWWQTTMVGRFPAEWRSFASELYEYQRWCRPVYVPPNATPPAGWAAATVDDEPVFVSRAVPFRYDMAGVLDKLRIGSTAPAAPFPTHYYFQAKQGFYDNLENHEIGAHYVATPSLRPAAE